MGSLDEVHKLFLQALMSHAVIKKTSAVTLFKQCAKLAGYAFDMSISELGQVFNEINSNISGFGLEIKEIRSEINMEEHVVLVNVIDHSNVFEKLNHIYSAKEREFFRRVLEMMVTNEDAYGTVTTIDCLNMPDNGLGPSKIEELMKRFASDYWFISTQERAICPGPRCIAEFETYLKTHYKDHVSICPLCNNVVFYGTNCLACDTISHKYCVISYNKKNRDTPKCSCNNEYPVGTITQEDLEFFSPQPQKKSKGNSTQESQNDVVNGTPGPSRRGAKRSRE